LWRRPSRSPQFTCFFSYTIQKSSSCMWMGKICNTQWEWCGRQSVDSRYKNPGAEKDRQICSITQCEFYACTIVHDAITIWMRLICWVNGCICWRARAPTTVSLIYRSGTNRLFSCFCIRV
jgi:hypothetical protein